MKHKTILFLLVHLLVFSTAWLGGSRGNPANGQTTQAPAIPERRVGNATPGALFSALERIVDRVIGFYVPAYDSLPTITLEEITQAEFEDYQKSYRPRLDPSLSRVQHTAAAFTIPTAKARLVFNRDWDNRITEDQVGYYYAQYKGYYPDLGLYAVSVNGSAAIEWGESLLIDSQTSTVYVLASVGDGPSRAHLVSPGNTYLAYYDNQLVSSPETFIGLIRITGSPRRYQEHASFRSAGHLVESLAWISDRAFAVKFQIGKSGGDFKYFKTKDLGAASASELYHRSPASAGQLDCQPWGQVMTHLSLALLVVTLGISLSGTARADPFDWSAAVDTGGIWTTELGQDRPGEIRALVGRTKGGRHNRYSVNVIVNGSDRIELLDEMGDELPKVGFTSGRIVITTVDWPTGADKSSETRRCFRWNADSRTYLPAVCP